jgi:intraflagellar transport protein 81
MKFEQELNELRAENETLRETMAVLHDEKNRTDKRVKHYERKHGVEGLSKMITGVNEFIEKNEQIDAIKGKSLLEMSAIVQQLSQKIEDLKTTIQPQVQEHKNLKNQMAQLEPTYREEKQKFDHITADAKSSLDEAREVFQKEKNEVYENDSKADILTHQIKVIKTFQDM